MHLKNIMQIVNGFKIVYKLLSIKKLPRVDYDFIYVIHPLIKKAS